MKIRSVAFLLTVGLLTVAVWAQEQQPRFDAGVVLSVISAQPYGSMGGPGVRFGYYIHPEVAVDTELAHNPALFGDAPHDETIGFVGIKAGQRFWDAVGVFAKIRPGVVHCDSINCLGRFTQQHTFFALDIGGAVEYYAGRHSYVRFDFGDTIIPYGSATATGYPGPALGTRHHKNIAFGVGVRF